ncbi:MAG: response regulator [Candidatus Omnitrophota bacterium]|nr:MAG: response regulator [Candidatus Omnitrophota bacterium]
MKRILIVEDEKSMHEVYQDIFLEEEGQYHLFFAFSVEEALNILSKEAIDLIVLDIIMEPIPGQYLYLKLMQDEDLKQRKIPVIIASVLKKDMFERLENVGEVCVFEKPLAREPFLKKVGELTGAGTK